jgi:ATP phosphoribosyltransferase regulatory subunit
MSCRRRRASIEELRRSLLDRARGYGFELVMPPLLEHLDSLLTGTGHELDLRTFKLVDQLSGRTLGPACRHHAAGRAHRCAPAQPPGRDPAVLLRPGAAHPAQRASATREPLQFGAEIFGHAGLEADLEVQELALDACSRPAWTACSSTWPMRACCAACSPACRMDAAQLQEVVAACRTRTRRRRRGADARAFPPARDGLRRCSPVRRHRGAGRARASVAAAAADRRALDDLQWLATHLREATRAARGLRPVGHERLCLLQRPALRASMAPAPATRWRAAGATTRSARCSAATGRRWASAWT